MHSRILNEAIWKMLIEFTTDCFIISMKDRYRYIFIFLKKTSEESYWKIQKTQCIDESRLKHRASNRNDNNKSYTY